MPGARGETRSTNGVTTSPHLQLTDAQSLRRQTTRGGCTPSSATPIKPIPPNGLLLPTPPDSSAPSPTRSARQIRLAPAAVDQISHCLVVGLTCRGVEYCTQHALLRQPVQEQGEESEAEQKTEVSAKRQRTSWA